MISHGAVRTALATVRDPELDEPLTELGFVASVEISEHSVRVRLRLPTYFCAPNFAYMMTADARTALEAVPGVKSVEVALIDHHASHEISSGVRAGRGFVESFPGEATDELDELRRLFQAKAFIARQGRLCAELTRRGFTPAQMASLLLGDLPECEDTSAYLARRAELGLKSSADAPFIVDAAGRVPPKESIETHLRFARAVSVSLETNASFCKGLLATRYGSTEEATA
ncbi:MAG: iron-sulfur cluster assembly protein [Actinomycetota bacterium]|nr:iron-sulfur cluster assembly protein [Actinomycetota bacterium]